MAFAAHDERNGTTTGRLFGRNVDVHWKEKSRNESGYYSGADGWTWRHLVSFMMLESDLYASTTIMPDSGLSQSRR